MAGDCRYAFAVIWSGANRTTMRRARSSDRLMELDCEFVFSFSVARPNRILFNAIRLKWAAPRALEVSRFAPQPQFATRFLIKVPDQELEEGLSPRRQDRQKTRLEGHRILCALM